MRARRCGSLSRLRWLWDEWGIPVLGALPVLGVYIWLDRNPSFWGVVIFNVAIGGAAGAVAFSSAWLASALQSSVDDQEPPPWWPYGLGGFVFGGWVNLTLRAVLESGPTGSTLDAVIRALWSVAGLAAVGAVAIRGRWLAAGFVALGWLVSLAVIWGVGR